LIEIENKKREGEESETDRELETEARIIDKILALLFCLLVIGWCWLLLVGYRSWFL
jgi:hypothetical protein